jgi:hypothetical protein
MTTPTPERPRRWRKRLVALGLGLLALEVALPLLASRVPLASRLYLPPPLWVLGASSKDGLVPRDWVLVLGDSYAAGSGDWLIEAVARGGNPPFQVTHLLHERLGRDVIDFGKGGADSVNATAYSVSKRFAQLRRNGLADPDDVVVYFYEGNDLNDNLRRARKDFGLGEREAGSYTAEELDERIAERASEGLWKGLPGMLYGPYVVQKFLKREAEAIEEDGGASKGGFVRATGAEAGGEDRNRVVSGGEPWVFETSVQAPALELTEDETDLALGMLDGSLRWVERRFQGAGLTLVYLPSPVTCYEIRSPIVRAQSYEGRGTDFDAERVVARSDALRARVAAIAADRGIAFVDATPALRERARVEPVHGPVDGGHLNRAGYEVLADLLAPRLRRDPGGRP